ncbi:MAG: GDSL-type esterase/lipase family protein [Bacteroidia bacterium]
MNRVFLFLLCACFLTPIRSQIRVLPLGNSITQGKVGLPSYRQALWKMFEEANISVDFVGSLDAPFLCDEDVRDGFDPDHEGHWGFRIDEIIEQEDGNQNCRANNAKGGLALWLQSYTPDIALIHLGTNDIFQRYFFQTSESVRKSTITELDSVITLLRADNPQIHIYLAQLLPVSDPDINEEIIAYNQSVKELSRKRQSLQSPVILVDMHTDFSWETDTYDGVHPNEAGGRKMAQTWFQSIMSPLPAAARNAQLSQLPSSQSVWIPETLRSATSLSLIDAKGRVLQQYSEIPNKLDISGLPSGLYYLTFEGESPMVRKIWL